SAGFKAHIDMRTRYAASTDRELGPLLVGAVLRTADWPTKTPPTVARCPDGYKTVYNVTRVGRATIRRNWLTNQITSQKYVRQPILILLPSEAEVLGISPSLGHPKFCWS